MARAPITKDEPHYVVWMRRSKDLKLISRALKEYQANGAKPINQFEEDYGCKISYSECGNINGVSFVNKGAETMFYLKYGNK